MRAALLMVLLAAGCVAPATGPPEARLLHAPTAASLVPDVSMLPPGFALSEAQGRPEGPAMDGAVAIFERSDGASRHRVVAGVLAFRSLGEAEAFFAAMAEGTPGARRALPAEGMLLEEWSEPEGRGDAVHLVTGLRGFHVAWVVESHRGAPPAVDARLLVEGILGRVPSP